MRIEAFSESKYPGQPERNEDALLIVPGRAYGVIDGATDRSGRQYEGGVTSGRLAAIAVASALNAMFSAPQRFSVASVVETATEAIAAEYRRLGLAEVAAKGRNNRFNATLALAVPEKDQVHLLLVGDSGIRVNGSVMYQDDKVIDQVTAQLRVHAWRLLAGRGEETAKIDRLAGEVAFHGTRHCADRVAPFLSRQDLAEIETTVADHYRAHHPEVPTKEMLELVQGGILSGQSPHQNNPASALGYSCFDGFAVPKELTRHIALPTDAVQAVELFTDGYFAPGETVGLQAWEEMFARVEHEDPAKIGRFPSVKGSGNGLLSDDRTYLAIHF